MSQIRLYIDEDSMRQLFLHALRARGVDVRTAYEDGLLGRSDEEQLRWATTQGRVLCTYNIADFYRLHAALLGRGESHTGIILMHQGRYALGVELQGVLRLIAAKSAEAMVGQVEFLGAWVRRT